MAEQDLHDKIEKELDSARAKGFAAGLYFATSVASEFTADEGALFDGTQGAETLADELDDLEGEGVEETMFEPIDAAVFAPYGIGRKPRDVERFDACYSVIDNEHYVWALEGTEAANDLADKKSTVRTDADSDIYDEITVEALKQNKQ